MFACVSSGSILDGYIHQSALNNVCKQRDAPMHSHLWFAQAERIYYTPKKKKKKKRRINISHLFYLCAFVCAHTRSLRLPLFLNYSFKMHNARPHLVGIGGRYIWFVQQCSFHLQPLASAVSLLSLLRIDFDQCMGAWAITVGPSSCLKSSFHIKRSNATHDMVQLPGRFDLPLQKSPTFFHIF